MVRRKLSVLNMLLVVGSAIVASLMFFGCGGGGSSSQPANGTLGVSLTDATAGGFDAVNVTVSKIRVHQSASATENSAGWTDITLNPARKINLLNLTNGALEELGETPLAAGHYTQLRLVLVPNTGTHLANSVVLSGDPTEIPLDTPSGVQSGIKLINQFDVAAGQRVDLVLDFDAGKSVVKTGGGKYLLKPVIKVIPTVLNGINGFVEMSSLGSNVSVTAQQNGTIIRSTVPSTQTGEFFLARLVPGNYDVVLTADGRTTKVIASVPVASTTSITAVSTSAVPITMPVSTTTPTTRNISGTVTLSTPPSIDEAAFVAAKQTFGGGPTVTVKSQAVDVVSPGADGAYLLTLPIDAPLLGQFGTGSLPITFNAQSTAAGKYNVEASFTGYVTQSFPKDISAADATQNFILVPGP